MEHLATILQVLRENQFKVNTKKCGFGGQQIEYLDHVISIQGVAVDPEKVKSVVNWPTSGISWIGGLLL